MPPQREDFGTAVAGDVACELDAVKPQSKNRLPDSQLLSKLPFTFMDVKHSIPSKLFEPSLPLSIYYCVRDFLFAAALLFAVNYADQYLVGSPFAWMRWILWPVYSLAQGTIMWALFVVGHDCGHGSFSRCKTINHIFGHITHAPILVPYHSWRISHRHHHANTGNLNTDETWKPASQTEYDEMDSIAKIFRYHLIPCVWPLYLLGARGKSDKEAGFGFSAWFKESHFNPSMELFKPHERLAVLVSSLSCGAFFALLLYLGSIYGAVPLILNYWAPWIVFGAWLSLVTYLHHTDDSVPWYINEEWDKLKGGLCTIDRDYGDFINHIHHDIGTHVVHHLFYSIPHYNLKAATEAIKPVIGKYYRKSEKSIIGGYFDSAKFCRFVPDFGSLRYYTSYSKSVKKQN